MIQHQMAPAVPANVFAAERSASSGAGKFLAAMRAHESPGGITFVGHEVRKCAVRRVKISVVITIVRAGVDGMRIAVDELTERALCSIVL